VEYLIYLPAPIMALTFLGLRLFQPAADLLVNLVLHDVFALLVLASVGLTMISVIHGCLTTERGEKRPRGLGLVLAAVLLGSAFPAARLFMETFLPHQPLPGQSFYPLTALLVSLGFGWAIWKSNTAKRIPEKAKSAPPQPIAFKKVVGQ
jgi:hypothetical protein